MGLQLVDQLVGYLICDREPLEGTQPVSLPKHPSWMARFASVRNGESLGVWCATAVISPPKKMQSFCCKAAKHLFEVTKAFGQQVLTCHPFMVHFLICGWNAEILRHSPFMLCMNLSLFGKGYPSKPKTNTVLVGGSLTQGPSPVVGAIIS